MSGPSDMTTLSWEKLRERFPDELITKVDKGFGKVDTINHAVVTDRLLRWGGAWTYEITERIEVQGKDGAPHLLAVYGWMRIGGITRWEVGEVERPSTYGDEFKKAMSDFVKRAAMRFGVGLDLWTKEDLQSDAARISNVESRENVDGSTAALEGHPLPAAQTATLDRGPSEVGAEGSTGDGGHGEGTEASEGTSAPTYIDAPTIAALIKAFPSKAAATKEAHKRFGVLSLAYLTQTQADELYDAEVTL